LDSDIEDILFIEKQRFRQVWLWLILLGVSFFLTTGLIKQLFLGVDFGSKPMSDPELIVVWLIFGVGLPVGFFSANLTTHVYKDRLTIQLFPLHFNEQDYSIDQIQGFEAVTYRPLLDYGGWGIRYGRKGKAYNISGKKGVKLQFQSGRPLLIGSQKPNELTGALEKAKEIST
jgi:hypothetical protein